MKKVSWSGVKKVFLELLVGLIFGALFFGVLFALAEPFMSKCGVVYNNNENAYLTQNDESKEKPVSVIVLFEEEKEAVQYPERISLGEFKLTAYCPCVKCCGKTDGITATGTKAKAGRTIAVDPSVIPYGTTVYIGGQEYVAEDCGGEIKQNRIDVFFDSHQAALDFGVRYADVEIEL